MRDLAIVGSGFAGSILARVLARIGLDVVLIERDRHPRFALGESSTPLAAASLTRLARRFALPDLDALASYGRWGEVLPHLRRGLKRGFTFYHHVEPGVAYRPSAATRSLVAASPSDSVADCHWLRSDVDLHLVERAREEGVEVRESTAVRGLERRDGGFVLRGRDPGGDFTFAARRVVDASGPAAVVARALGARRIPVALPPRGLAYSHLRGIPPIEGLLAEEPPAGPYPDERAAVHHLLCDGWFYRLPFDDGVSSCGLLLTRPAWATGPDPAGDPEAAVHEQLRRRAPTVARQLAGAEPVAPWRWYPEVAHRLDRAAGEGWLALPHAVAFFDPLFSTGIAWALRSVERMADLLEGRCADRDHAALLLREADRIERLVALAWRALSHPSAFRAVTLLYFAAVSFQEARERLLEPPGDGFAWDGFLGVGDPLVDGWFEDASERLARDPEDFAQWVLRVIEPRDVAGLTTPGKGGLYGFDFESLVRGAGKLGLDAATVRARREALLR